MARMTKWLGLAALAFSLTGCVSAEQYQAMKLSRDQAVEQLNQADAEAKSARAQADAYKAQLDQLANSGNTSQAMIGNYSQQVAQLQAQNAAITAKYEDLLNKPPQIVEVGQHALPEQLNNALQQFASENPDLVDFDSALGVVKFKSDVTFASGSTDVNERAKGAIQRFSEILNSQSASGYQLMVAGHTDNTPVRNQKTIDAGNFDNWYLSAHRAIAVAAQLVENGVSRSRLGVAGYADERPIASNATSAGKAQNRRVEIMILPTTVRNATYASAGSAEHASHHATATPRTFDKDSASVDQSPILTK
jgi:chemotaxis protein MotB